MKYWRSPEATAVVIYYNNFLAKLALYGADRPKIDPDFGEATEGEEIERKGKFKTTLAQFVAADGSLLSWCVV